MSSIIFQKYITKVHVFAVRLGDTACQFLIVVCIQVYLGEIAMPIILDGQIYYRAMETCRIVGISKNTLFRWTKKGILGEAEYRDWRGWRLFSQNQVDTLKAITQQIVVRKELNTKS